MGLSGCTTQQVHRPTNYPLPPSKLMEAPKELEKVPENTRDLESVTKIIIRNYSSYHREALKLELLQDWVKTIHEINQGVQNDRN